MQTNISNLVNAAREGDKKAFSTLYQLTFAGSYFLALQLTGNNGDAENIVKESYSEAVKSLHLLKKPERFEEWIKYITAVKSVAFIKKNIPNAFSSVQPIPESEIIADNAEFLPEEFAENEDSANSVLKIIENLPTGCKVVTMLNYYNRMPVSRIAKILSCPEENVKALLLFSKAVIKNGAERLIKKGITPTPLTGAPVMARILAAAGKHQQFDVQTYNNVLSSLMNTFFVAEQKPVEAVTPAPAPAPVYSPPRNTYAAPMPPVTPADKKSPKKAIIAAVCAVGGVILLAGLIFGAIKLSSFIKEKNNPETSVGEFDAEFLDSISSNNDFYSKVLEDCYASGSGSLFTFAHYDNNDIPDLVIMSENDTQDTGRIYMNGEDSNGLTDCREIDLSRTWFGEKGMTVELTEYETNGNYGSKNITYTEYENSDADRIIVTKAEYSVTVTEVGTIEEWKYIENSETYYLDSMQEFNEYVEKMLGGYKQIVAGYSISEYCGSDEEIVDFITKTNTLAYEYKTVIELPTSVIETTAIPSTTEPVKVDYKWVESAVLNSYSSIKYFNEDTCVFKLPQTGKYGLIDNKGNVVIEPEYYGFSNCSYGPGYEPYDNYHYTATDENGNELEVDMDNFRVTNELHGGHGAENGTVPGGFADLDRYYNGLAAAKKNGKWGYVDKNYNTVVPFEYDKVNTSSHIGTDSCRGFSGDYVAVKKNGKMGIINRENQIIVPFEYTQIMQGSGGIFIAQKNGRWGFIGIGTTPKEPKAAKVPEQKTEWETNYLKTMDEKSFEYFNFILTDLDNNDIPDLILVMHRGTRGPITNIYMNGEYDENNSYEETGYFDYLYYSKQGKLATSSFYNYYERDDDTGKSYRNLDECFCYSYYENGSIQDSDYVHRVTKYDDDTKEVVGVRYYVLDENYNSVDISEEEFNVIFNDINDNYTKVNETSIESFKASGKDLSSYYTKIF